ncbi:MAG TPA: YciI family protein [Acidisarcina sp.]|nr:YciI family protein [Acidisarcina sp.]
MPEELSQADEIPRIKDVPRNLKQYFLGLLVKGERWNDTQGEQAAELMPQHLAFLRQQLEAQRYLVAGPVLDEGRLAGMMIIDAKTAQDALALASLDPAVKAGRLAVEIYPTFLPALDSVHAEY